MSVIFDINGEKVQVPYETAINSEFIRNLSDDFDTDDDIIIIIPNKYLNAIDNYIDFLNGHEQPIYDKDKMKLYLDMYSYFVDEEYFKYLIRELFKHWDQMYKMIYNEIPTRHQWDIFLNLNFPREYVPHSLLNNETFLYEWLSKKRLPRNYREAYDNFWRISVEPKPFDTDYYNGKELRQIAKSLGLEVTLNRERQASILINALSKMFNRSD